MTTGWAFRHNEDAAWDGWNDSAIASFRGKRLESLTREIIQNSLDAVASEEEPVYVTMTERRLKKSQIPNFDMLEAALSKCWESREHEAKNSRTELQTAREIASKDSISVLSISDECTTGMAGPCVHGKPFYSYLKARGQSGGSDDRGGSHGIGKAAPLCASDLRTIFASTMWKDDDSGLEKSIIQGRTTLMSHMTDGQVMSGVGYWGITETFDAIDGDDCDFDWLKQDDIGTTVHVVGWNRVGEKDWELQVLGWAAINFFPAFARDRLVLQVGDKTLNKDNIDTILNNEKLFEIMRKASQVDRLLDARYFYRCITEDDVIEDESQLIHLGRSSIKILIEEDAPRKFAVIRKNMLITDQLTTFWKRPPTRYKDFSGVFECLDSDGEKILRAMEPPAHDDLSKDNLPISEMDRGTTTLNALGQKLKDMLDKHATNESDDAGEVDFLKRFFADEADDGAADQALEERDPNGRFLITPKPVKLPAPKPIDLGEDENTPEDDLDDQPSDENGDTSGETGGAAGANEGEGGEGSGNGPGQGSGQGGTGERSTKPRPHIHKLISLHDCRFVRLNSDELRLHTTPTGTGPILIEILEVGADNDEELSIASSDVGEIKDGLLSIDVKKGERVAIFLKTSRPVVGGVKAIASSKD